MEENKKVLIDVKLNAAEALKELAIAKIRIDELREPQRGLGKTTDEGRQEYEAYGCGLCIKKRLHNLVIIKPFC